MNNADYPALWKSSDAASAACQRNFLILIRLHLLLLAATGLIAAWNPADPFYEKIVAWSVAGAMFTALIIGLAIRLLRLDDKWFEARAFAENAKEAAWRFMMQPAATTQLADDPIRSGYLDSLEAIRKRLPSATKQIAKFGANGDEVTESMQAARLMSVADRIDLYRKARVKEQFDWYTRKAKLNADSESRWFWIILGAEATAVVAAVIRVALVHDYNPTGGIAAVAACLVAWLQTKRFSDLANTYNVAAFDLKFIMERYGQAATEESLKKLVDEAEAAISREHRLWVEKRIGSA